MKKHSALFIVPATQQVLRDLPGEETGRHIILSAKYMTR
jgi:hypothetical protein